MHKEVSTNLRDELACLAVNYAKLAERVEVLESGFERLLKVLACGFHRQHKLAPVEVDEAANRVLFRCKACQDETWRSTEELSEDDYAAVEQMLDEQATPA